MSPRPLRNRPAALTRVQVLDAALAVVERAGADALSVRALARELGRAPMSLYAHFTSKDELRELMFERLMQRLLVAHYHRRWQAELSSLARHVRAVLLEHPRWIALLTGKKIPHSALHAYERLLTLMEDDGFDTKAAMLAFSAIFSHALGSALVEEMMHGAPPLPRQRLELVRKAIEGMPPDAYPRIAAAVSRFDEWSFQGVFELGLRALIAGLEESPRGGLPQSSIGARARSHGTSA